MIFFIATCQGYIYSQCFSWQSLFFFFQNSKAQKSCNLIFFFSCLPKSHKVSFSPLPSFSLIPILILTPPSSSQPPQPPQLSQPSQPEQGKVIFYPFPFPFPSYLAPVSVSVSVSVSVFGIALVAVG